MRVYLILSILLFSSHVFSQNVHLKGKSLSYNGKTIVLYAEKDFISGLPEKITETRVDENGDFQLTFSVDNITKIYIPAGYYMIEFYAYPGLNADIIFPRYREKTKDIYFVPLRVPAKVVEPDSRDLNNMIFNFDNDLSRLTEENMLRLEKKDKSALKNIIPVLDNKYVPDNDFFNVYKKYSFGMTEYIVYRDYLKVIVDKYFKNQKIDINNDAYTKLFKRVFFKYIDIDQFRKRKELTGIKLFSEIKSQIENSGIKDDDLTNYITLKILHDACYSPIIKHHIVFDAIDYFTSICKDDTQKIIALNILKKATRLAEGFKAPVISGYDINNNIKSSEDYKGKYIYMVFYEPANPKCINALKDIKNIVSKYSFLELVFICDRTKKPACVNELKNLSLHNNALFCDNFTDVKNKFKVIVSPSYFLIDKEGTIIKAHTPEPGNNLYKLLNNIHIKEIREGNIQENKYFR